MDWRSRSWLNRRLVLTGILSYSCLVACGLHRRAIFGVGLGPELVRMRMWTENLNPPKHYGIGCNY